MLFGHAWAYVNLNGTPCKEFIVERGVTQGCPLAPYIFLIIEEVLNHIIRQGMKEGRTIGVKFPRCNNKVYMDYLFTYFCWGGGTIHLRVSLALRSFWPSIKYEDQLKQILHVSIWPSYPQTHQGLSATRVGQRKVNSPNFLELHLDSIS